MIVIYVKELENEESEKTTQFPTWIRRIYKFIINKLNIIQIKNIDENKKIYLIPDITKTSIYKRINRRISKEKTLTEKVQIVLSKKVKKYEGYFHGAKIMDGKNVFLASIESILKIVLKERPLELQDIYILAKFYQEKNINLIRNLAPKVKTINVITKEIEKYNNLQDMMEEWGLSIVVGNNKRKGLKKAQLIINMDFAQEEIKQYIINRNSVIINLTGEKITELKGFEGIIVQDIRR